MQIPNFYVITGGPGSGKTTVLAELMRLGHRCIPEDARAVIQEVVGRVRRPCAALGRRTSLRRSSDGTIHRHLPRTSRRVAVCEWRAGSHLLRSRHRRCLHLRISSATRFRTLRSSRRSGIGIEIPVFLAPWWPEIYTTDSERRQSREEAERTEHAVAQTYTELGYRIVRLPLINPAERAEFILRHSIQI